MVDALAGTIEATRTGPPLSKEQRSANFTSAAKALVDKHFAGVELNPELDTNTPTPDDIKDRSVSVACRRTSTPGLKLVEANSRFRPNVQNEQKDENPDRATTDSEHGALEATPVDEEPGTLEPAVRAEITEYLAINPSKPLTPEAQGKIQKRSVLYGHAVSGSTIKIEIIEKPNVQPEVQIEFVYPPEKNMPASERPKSLDDLNEFETEEIEATFGININQK